MSSQVVRVEQFRKGSLNNIGREANDPYRGKIKHRNEDIDQSRNHLNEYFLMPNKSLYGEFKEISKDMNIVNSEKLKKNAIAFEGMIITSDQEFFKSLGWVPGEPTPEKVQDFFKQAYAFALAEIGFKGSDENILSAVVHYDEKTPHLQLYYVPVVDSWKEKVYQRDENGKIMTTGDRTPIPARDEKGKMIYNHVKDSVDRRINRSEFWKNKGGQTSYSRMQDRFQEQIGQSWGLDRGEVGSTREHTTKQRWQKQQLDEELERIKQENERLKAKNAELTILVSKAEQTISEHKQAYDELLDAGAEEYQKFQKLKAENEALSVEIKKLKTEKGNLGLAKLTLEGEIKEKTETLSQKDQDIEKKTETLNQLETDLQNSKNSLEEAQIKLKTAKTELEPLELKNKALEDEKAKLTADIAGMKNYKQARQRMMEYLQSVSDLVTGNHYEAEVNEGIRRIDEFENQYGDQEQ
ncbi:MAG: plasmid recombination protein [Bacilli bacterium]|nr:plasmid recombination protein [Bacilli bacterium]